MRFSSTTATDLLPERKGHTAPILRLRSRLAPTVCLGMLVALLVQGTLLGRMGLAQETTSENTTATKASSTSEEKNPLAAEQKRIAQQYDHFEQVLLRMAELTATTDPDRAALLRRVVAQSKKHLVGPQFRETTERLSEGKLSQAIESQEGLRKDLHALLVLLQSENRQKELEARREQLRRQLKKLNRLIGRQRQLRRQTERTDRPKDLAKPQAKLADQTGRLSQSMSEAKPPQDGSQEGSQEGGPSQDKKPSGSKSSPSGSGQPGPPQKKPSEKPQDDSAESPSGPASEATETSENSETQKRLDAARKQMESAREKLEKAQKDQSIEAQEKALDQLQQAKSELEAILKQLREEERGRLLENLESRLQKMLATEKKIHASTCRLSEIPHADRTHRHEIEAGRLADDQQQVVLEAEKALLLLGDDATAVALPEALRQATQDMREIVGRLERAQVDPVTQSLEEDVIETLGEMLSAVRKELSEMKEKGKPSDQQSKPGEAALIDKIAELKMIRSLQLRVNRRTERFSKWLSEKGDDVSASTDNLRAALRRLARRQAKIYQITRDIQMGKNQ